MRQGDATTVRDFRRHAGLDLLPRLLIQGGELDVAVVRSILEPACTTAPRWPSWPRYGGHPNWPRS